MIVANRVVVGNRTRHQSADYTPRVNSFYQAVNLRLAGGPDPEATVPPGKGFRPRGVIRLVHRRSLDKLRPRVPKMFRGVPGRDAA